MTVINTKTANWEIVFDSPALEGLSKDQLDIAKTLFLIVGDALFVFNMLPNKLVQDSLAFHYQFVISQLAQDVQGAVMSALQQQLWVTPLEGEFSYESLFGTDLLEDLKSILLGNDAEDILQDAFPEDAFTGPQTPDVGKFLLEEFFGKGEEPEIDEADPFDEDEEDEEGEKDGPATY